MNEDTYRMKNYELELQKAAAQLEQWKLQRLFWVFTGGIATGMLLLSISQMIAGLS